MLVDRAKPTLGALPAIGAALLPKIACPACWPAYAGVLSALGLGFLVDNTGYLFGLTIGFLVIALAALGWKARRRGRYGPLALGVAASIAILVGKFYVEANVVMFAGVAMLVGASLWNGWPQRAAEERGCSCKEVNNG